MTAQGGHPGEAHLGAGGGESLAAAWWRSLDHGIFFSVLILMGTGLILSLAAGPAIANRIGVPEFYFTSRHFMAAPVAVLVFAATSMLSPRQVRRVSLGIFAAAFLAMLALVWGPEVKGAKRWIQFAGFSLQPSEFAKPAFVILSAWLFSEYHKRAAAPALPMALALYVLFVGGLVLQPDFGQAVLVSVVWGAMFFLAGMPVLWMLVLGAAGAGGGLLAYQLMPHVRFRVDSFFDPTIGDGYQTGRALKSFLEGGWLGVGPGEGRIKAQLPDAHADFVFSVLAEEYGVLACLALAGLYAVITLRGFAHAQLAKDGYVRIAVAALTVLFAAQALVNMAVNTGLLPAKGMTLPFVSYGGSSLVGMAFAMGALLALARSAEPACHG